MGNGGEGRRGHGEEEENGTKDNDLDSQKDDGGDDGIDDDHCCALTLIN